MPNCSGTSRGTNSGREMTRLNPNSAKYWQPPLVSLSDGYPIRVADSEFIEFDFFEAVAMADTGEMDAYPREELEAAADRLGYPVYVRSDLTSGKGRGTRAIRADSASDLPRAIGNTTMEAAIHDQVFSWMMLREWIDIETEFANSDGLDIGAEFRLFATPETHECSHYYWPEESIKQADVPEDEWKAARNKMAQIDLPAFLGDVAMAAADAVDVEQSPDDHGREWSVDFARDVDGDWWLIDMALAEQSHHPECHRR